LNVHAVDTLIGDITPPESLMKTLTDRKIAEEQQVTYETQEKAQVRRQGVEKQTAIADMQGEVVKANQGVEISEKIADAEVKKATGAASSVKIAAEANAEATKLNAEAEATKKKLIGEADADAILAVGTSTAKAYELAVNAMGKDNFTTFKVTEEIGKGKVKIMPDLLINGGGQGNGSLDGLLGMQIMEMMGKGMKPANNSNVIDIPVVDETTDKKGKK